MTPVRNPWRVAFASTLILAVAMVLLVQWRQTQFERERRQLEGERDRLAAQIAELKQRRDLLRELQALTASKEFYILLFLGAREAELRLEERVLRRIPWTSPQPGQASWTDPPRPGIYKLQLVTEEALLWNGLVAVSIPVAERGGCLPDIPACVAISEEDFARLARLKPGAVLLVLP